MDKSTFKRYKSFVPVFTKIGSCYLMVSSNESKINNSLLQNLCRLGQKKTGWLQQTIFFVELFLKISKHVTNGNELHLLGNGLGLTYDEIRSIEYNYRDINRAGYQVLVGWRKKKSSEQMSEVEMKEELKTVLRSESVGMRQVVSLHF